MNTLTIKQKEDKMENLGYQAQGRTFKELYNSLPKRKFIAEKKEFIERICAITMKSPQTVRGWISGTFQPDALTKKIIAEELQLPVESLFPEK